MQGLKEIGLTDNEIKVFTALNKEGPTTVWNIATKTNIKRTTTYDIIKSLIQKNLVFLKFEGKKRLYASVEPKVLLEQIEIKKDALKKTVQELLHQQKSSRSKLKITTFRGAEGIRLAMNMLLIDKTPIYGWGNNALSEKVLSFYPENFAQKRIEKRIKLHAIIEPGKKFSAKNSLFSIMTKIKHHHLMKEQRIVYFLQKGKVLYLKMNFSNPEVVVIEDTDYYTSQKRLFDYLWIHAK